MMWQENTPDLELLSEHHVPKDQWESILKASLLAKTTYFFENSNFNEAEILYLLKIACASANMPLKAYSLAEVIEMSKDKMPILHHWLKRFGQLLKQAHQKKG